MNDEDEQTDITGHPIGVTATTRRGAIVSLELLLNDTTDE